MDCLSSERIILFHEKALKKFGDLEGVYKPEYPPPPLILGIMSNNFSVRKVTLTMNLLQNIQELPKIEKMVIMEFLWKDLFEENDELESPEWHKNALTETEERVEYGREEMIGWAEAKRRLRESFE